MTDDTSMSKEETLNWVSKIKFRIDDFNTLCENDEALVGLHSVSEPYHSLYQVMLFAQMKGGKLSPWSVNRAFPRV